MIELAGVVNQWEGSRAVSVWRGCRAHGLQDVRKWSSGNWSMQAAVSQTW